MFCKCILICIWISKNIKEFNVFSDAKKIRALYDYEARTHEDLSFKKGEILYLINNEWVSFSNNYIVELEWVLNVNRSDNS